MSVTEIDLSEIVSAVKSKKGKRVKKVVVEEVVDEVKEASGEGAVDAVVVEAVEAEEPVAESGTTLVEEVVKVDKAKKAPTEKQLAARQRAKEKREEVKRLAEEAIEAEKRRVAVEEAKKVEKKRIAAEKRAEKRKLAAMEEVEEVEEPVLVRAVVKPERTPKVVKVRPDVKLNFNTYVRKAREVEREVDVEEPLIERDFGVVMFGDRAPAYRKRFF